MNTDVLLIISAVLVMALFVLSFRGLKTRKLRITTAKTNLDGSFEELEVTRKFGDSWNDLKDMKLYHLSNGKRLWLANHWILRIEEI